MFDKPARVRMPYSWVEYIPFAFKLIEVLSPKVVVELGTHSGNSFCAFNQAIKKLNLNSMCFAIDTWEGDKHSGKYDFTVFNELYSYCKIHYNQSASLLKKSFDFALEDFQNRTIDLLHIDGLHTYEAVFRDFHSWLPKLSDEGVVLFHDINVFESDFGVHKFWSEVKTQFPSYEFLFGNGLGVLFVGSKIPHEFITKTLEYLSNELVIKIFTLQGKLIQSNIEKEESNEEVLKLKKEVHSLNFILEKYRKSRSYYIGSLIIKPFSIIKKKCK